MFKATVKDGLPDHLPDIALVKGLTMRLGLAQPVKRVPDNYQWAIFMFINGFITIGLLSIVAKVSHLPFIFPSLGATAFLFFFNPKTPSASPRNAILGHSLAAIAGYISLLLFGLTTAPSIAVAGIDTTRVLALAFSFALSGSLLVIFKAGHPPAGATALIVSLGIISTPSTILVLILAVVLLTIQAFTIHHFAHSDFPMWARKQNANDTYTWTLESTASSNLAAAVTITIFIFINGFITTGILSGIAMLLKVPFIFPSLGASAFLFFFYPNLPSSSPRNAILGTLVAIICGYIALNICFWGTVTTTTPDADLKHILATALSLALTGMFMILLKVPHPPAAATALIVSLGIVVLPTRLAIIELGIITLALQAFLINRLAQIDYPIWAKKA